MTEQEYRNFPALSQSHLKLLIGGYRNYLANKDKDEAYIEYKKHFKIGKLIDKFATEGREEYKNSIAFYKDDYPSKTIENIIRYMIDNDLSFNNNGIEKAVIYYDYYKCAENKNNRKTAINKILPHEEFYNFVKNSINKLVVSSDEIITIGNCMLSLENNFKNELFDYVIKDNFIINYFQTPLFGTLEGEKIKGLLDKFKIDHLAKTVTITDFKSYGDFLLNFFKDGSYRLRYDIQSAMYYELVQQNLSKLGAEGYEIKFEFIVVSKVSYNSKRIIVSDSFIRHGFLGSEYYPGIYQLIQDYKFFVVNKEEIPFVHESRMDFGKWSLVDQEPTESILNHINL